MLVDSEFKLNFSLIDEIEPVGNVAFAKNGLVRGKLRFHCIEGEGGQMVGVQSIEKGVGSDSGLEAHRARMIAVGLVSTSVDALGIEPRNERIDVGTIPCQISRAR